jgi:hypothetical protein
MTDKNARAVADGVHYLLVFGSSKGAFLDFVDILKLCNFSYDEIADISLEIMVKLAQQNGATYRHPRQQAPHSFFSLDSQR